MDKPTDFSKPRWGQARRLALIDLRLQYDGRINRRNIQEFFDISTPQATTDLELYRKLAGDNIRYDGREKAYVSGADFHPQFGRSAATRYLDELFRLECGLVDRDESFVGYLPPTGVVATPSRAIESGDVAVLVTAMRDKTALQVTYQSMNSEIPVERVISPHAMGFDGLRWHVRAWCHERRTFRDFAIGRLHIHGPAKVEETMNPGDDEGWTTWVDIVIEPHGGLSPSQREAVMRDYEMEGGRRRVPCRKAMLFYTLRHLNLESDEISEDPARQHVILANRPEVMRWMGEDRDLSPGS